MTAARSSPSPVSPVSLVSPASLVSLLSLVFALLASACPGEKPAVEAASAPDPAKYAAYFTRYPFGGRTTDVWRDRLEELKPGGAKADPALYSLTVERAKQNGLVVEDGAPVVVKLSPELAAVLMKRLEVK